MNGVKEEAGYKPEVGFQEDSKDPLVDLDLTDSRELWLIQWPHNELPDFHGKELTLRLDTCLGSFDGSSGKAYDLVSCSAQEPDATVFLSSASETKIVGKIARRVSVVHYPEPKELEKRENEKKSKRLSQLSVGSALLSSANRSGTSSRSTKIRNSSSTGRPASTHSSRHRSSLSEVGEQLNAQKRRRTGEYTGSYDRSALDLG